MAAAAVTRKVVEFYVIQLSQLADRSIYVSMTATTVDDEEPQLLDQQVLAERVGTIDEATDLIRKTVLDNGPAP